MPIAFVYTSFIFKSIFLALNTNMPEFCKFLEHGLQYDNNTVNFTVRPCCFFSKRYKIDATKNIPEQYQKYKSLWKNENLNKTCKVCIDHEKSGMESYRQASFDMVPTDATAVSVLTVAINKECNLACPQCSSDYSSLWYRENLRNGIKESPEVTSYHIDNHRGKTTENFISLFDENDFDNLKYIKFGGGEPLMTDTHLIVLDKIKDPSTVELQYTSNFSIMPSAKTLEKWSKFKNVKWMASIDGTEDRFSLLRWPHTWEKLEKLCDRAVAETPDNVTFGIEHTLNMLNIFYFDKLEKWYLTKFCKGQAHRRGVLSLHNVFGKLSLAEVPLSLKNSIIEKYGKTHKITKILNSQSKAEDYGASVRYMDLLDKQRKTNWRSTFAEIEMHYD